MLSKYFALLLVTALAPAIWGSTYLVTSQWLPADLPLTAGALRALPAGLLLLLLVRKLPTGSWWWKSLVLGALNIGVFFALLFIAAYRLPGGVAATVGAIQPLIVAGLATLILHERLTLRVILSGLAGVVGVALLVLQSQARLDAIGLAAALGGAVSMGAGVVLAKKWGHTEKPLITTSWQLIAGGMLLVPLALFAEGVPSALTPVNVAGYAYLAVLGTALAYVLWFRGIQQLPVTGSVFLGLLSPVVATILGWVVLGEDLSLLQGLGAVVIAGSIVSAALRMHVRKSPRGRPVASEPAATVPACGVKVGTALR